jgi:adenylyl cyclase-associated protein
MDDKVLPTVSRTELTAILHRLEAATSRLEDMAASTIDLPKLNGAAPTPAPTGPLPAPPTTSRAAAESPKPAPEALPESVEDFDTFISSTVKKYVNLSDEVGGPVAEQVCQIGRIMLGFG